MVLMSAEARSQVPWFHHGIVKPSTEISPSVVCTSRKPWNASAIVADSAGAVLIAVLALSPMPAAALEASPAILPHLESPQLQLADRAVQAPTTTAVPVSVSVSVPAAVFSSPQVVEPVVKASTSRFIARLLQHFGGGGISGAIGAALVYPLDTIKTRMQAQSTTDDEQPQYKDEIDCFKKLVSDEGVGSLYSGLIPQLVGVAPEKAVKLTVNELLLELLEHMMPGAGVCALELIAGGGGGFSQVVFTNPLEVVKVRLQTQAADKKGLLEVLKELGFRGLYCGVGVTMARDIPSSGVFFACYAFLKQLYPEQSFVDGFLAAIPATLVSNPMDVVKTRLQMELAPGEVRPKDGMDCLKKLYVREGAKALFKGTLARVLRTSPQFGITFLLYSLICSSP